MLEFLYHLSDVTLFILLICVSIVISFIAILLVKRYIPLKLRYKDNPVIGYTSSLISIIYGVLVGLTALYLLNNISYTTDAVQREANAVADIYHDSLWLQEPARDQLKQEVRTYLTQTIDIEWPLMAHGQEINIDGDLILSRMANIINQSSLTHPSDLLIMHDLLSEVKTLYDARHQRIHMSHAELNTEIWIVIFIGSVLTLFINYLFGMNFYLHLITVSAAALMTSSMIFLLLTLDRPFQGEFVIAPDSLRAVLNFIEEGADKMPHARTDGARHKP